MEVNAMNKIALAALIAIALAGCGTYGGGPSAAAAAAAAAAIRDHNGLSSREGRSQPAVRRTLQHPLQRAAEMYLRQ
jgi:adenosylmethionine-8-amino-7-oxononanoate aminotransferase